MDLADLVERSAFPEAVRTALDRLDTGAGDRIAASPALAEAFVTVVAASRSATRLIETEPVALDVLADLDTAAAAGAADVAITDLDGIAGVADAGDPDQLVRAKRLAQLRITALDLLGRDDPRADHLGPG